MKFRKAKAFTLMELLIYSGILVVSAGLIGGIVYTISRANLRTQVNEELNNQLILFEEVFRQKIQIAKGINSISGSLLELNMGNSTSTFSLGATDNTVYLQETGGNQVALNDPTKVKVNSLLFTPTGASGAAISNTHHYAWNDQVGWIDFAYPGGNVQAPTGEGDLKGLAYVLSDSHWISLNCISTDSCYDAVNNPTGIDYKVSSDADGILSEWAWSENFGWISFNCKTGGDESEYPFEKDICDTSDYKVQDLRMNTSAIKVDITLQYNSEKAELSTTSTNSFVFNLITPTK